MQVEHEDEGEQQVIVYSMKDDGVLEQTTMKNEDL